MSATAIAEQAERTADTMPQHLELVTVATQHQVVQPLAGTEPANESPFVMALRAVERGMTPEMVERMLAIQERWEASQARKAYFDAFANFRAESVRVIRNTERTAGPLKGTKYADLSAVVDAVTLPLSRHKLSHSWKLTKDEPDWIEVTCTLSHSMGYGESVFMGGPPDTSDGGKTPIQRRMSTVSMLERYTLKAVTGVAEEDDDGSGGAGNNQRTGDEKQKPPAKTNGAPPTDAKPTGATDQAASKFYPDADFKKNRPAWETAIKAGKQTADRVIAKVESVAPLTEEQKKQIRDMAPAQK